ncbi:MAG: PilW family protein [Pseudomonadota bacterium]
MNRHHFSRVRRQAGLGLAEVLVAMAIGLVLLGAIAYLLIGSKQMSSTQEDVGRMQESARNAMEMLGKAVRQAGYQLDVDQDIAGEAMVGTDYGGTGPTAQADTLTLRHDPSWVKDTAVTPNLLKGQETNCEGTLVTSNNVADLTTGVRPANTNLIEYAFSVSNNRLLCKADASNPATGGVIVADNIENMQVTYGIGNGAEMITEYTAVPTATQWAHVAAVRITLLVRGPTPNLAPNNSQTYTYNGVATTSTDGRLRQVYTSTFAVRNQARWK